MMRLASLGLAARNKANRKVRQPLSEVVFTVPSAAEASTVEKYIELLEDELNVKRIRVESTAGKKTVYSLNPLPKQLGQKYGRRFPAIRQALNSMDAESTAQHLLRGEPVDVLVDGYTYSILPEEVEVHANTQAQAGTTVVSDGPYLAVLFTELTPALIREGLAREFVRRVQDLRKTVGLDIADRIRLVYESSPGLTQAIEDFRDYIMEQTLAVEMRPGTIPEKLPQVHDEFDGETVTIGLESKA